MRAVRDAAALPAALEEAAREAQAAFGDGSLYLERLVERPRHVEVQIVGDAHGTVRHLGDRECSIQRRYQKLAEETPAPGISPAARRRLWEAALALARQVGYVGVGTAEFLVEGAPAGPDAEQRFSFLEINARLQVEHPITEVVSGVDLVKEQLRIAAGLPTAIPPEPELRGAALELRVLAEDPAAGFCPATGTIGLLREPAGPGVRVDSACFPGLAVPLHYDSLLAKLVCWGADRAEAIARARRALDEYVLTGLPTTLPFHRFLLRDPAFLAGEYSTAYVAERWEPHVAQRPPDGTLSLDEHDLAVLAAALAQVEERQRAAAGRGPGRERQRAGSRWQDAARREALR